MPYELYEADIPLAGLISEDQLHKTLDKKEFACESLNPTELTGIVNEADSGIICAGSFPLSRLAELDNPQALIADMAPAFSYLREYCIMHQTPLYYGLRHSETVFSGKKVTLGHSKIEL
jgi:hypothetical protein